MNPKGCAFAFYKCISVTYGSISVIYTVIFVHIRFGSGFTLQVKVKPLPLSVPDPTSVSVSGPKDRPKSPENTADSTELLHTFIQDTFPGANLSEEHQVGVANNVLVILH